MITEQSRPAVNGAAEEKTPGDGISAASLSQPAETVAEQLRRRRRASWRLPPLESGLRDPWDIERRSA
jgi:hypothetical protein